MIKKFFAWLFGRSKKGKVVEPESGTEPLKGSLQKPSSGLGNNPDNDSSVRPSIAQNPVASESLQTEAESTLDNNTPVEKSQTPFPSLSNESPERKDSATTNTSSETVTASSTDKEFNQADSTKPEPTSSHEPEPSIRASEPSPPGPEPSIRASEPSPPGPEPSINRPQPSIQQPRPNMSKRCPRSGEEMQEVEILGEKIDISSKGCYFDRGELTRILGSKPSFLKSVSNFIRTGNADPRTNVDSGIERIRIDQEILTCRNKLNELDPESPEYDTFYAKLQVLKQEKSRL